MQRQPSLIDRLGAGSRGFGPGGRHWLAVMLAGGSRFAPGGVVTGEAGDFRSGHGREEFQDRHCHQQGLELILPKLTGNRGDSPLGGNGIHCQILVCLDVIQSALPDPVGKGHQEDQDGAEQKNEGNGFFHKADDPPGKCL